MNAGADFIEAQALLSLSALAQPSRLRVFRMLVGAGPSGIKPGGIAEALDMPSSALSFHLRELRRCGLVTRQREGRCLRYRADMEAMAGLMDFLVAHCCAGNPCMVLPDTRCRHANAGHETRCPPSRTPPPERETP